MIIIIFILEHIHRFKYLGNMVSNTNELDINYKMNNFITITGIINNITK